MATTYDTIYFKRGLDANLPALAYNGEPLWTTDTHRLLVGTGTSKKEFAPLTFFTPEMFGGSTENDDNYQAFADVVAAMPAGSKLFIGPGTYLLSNEFLLKSDISIECQGTLKLTGATTGGALVGPYGVSNVSWVGGTLDCDNIVNGDAGENGIGLSGSSVASNNNVFRGITIKNAKRGTLYGGKGFTIHQQCSSSRFYDMVVENCSIGFSVEGFDLLPSKANIIDGVIVRRATERGAWLYQGGATGLDDPNNFSCIINNAIFEDCDIDSSGGHGIIDCDRATGIQLNAFFNNVNSTNYVTPIRGSISNSRIIIDADINNINFVFDAAAISGGSSSKHDCTDLVIDARVKVRGLTDDAGYLVRYTLGEDGNELLYSYVRIAHRNYNGAGLMYAANSSIYYDLLRLDDGFRVSGRSATPPTYDATYREKIETLGLALDSFKFATSPGTTAAILTAVGTNYNFDLRNGNGETVIKSRVPASGESGVLLRYHNGTAIVVEPVTVGAVDSGGTGYKVLRVPN